MNDGFENLNDFFFEKTLLENEVIYRFAKRNAGQKCLTK